MLVSFDVLLFAQLRSQRVLYFEVLVSVSFRQRYQFVFRHLDQLEVGDEIVINSEEQSFTYIVHNTLVVSPTFVEVMAQTESFSLTLISCYPYLVDNQRIIVQASLKTN